MRFLFRNLFRTYRNETSRRRDSLLVPLLDQFARFPVPLTIGEARPHLPAPTALPDQDAVVDAAHFDTDDLVPVAVVVTHSAPPSRARTVGHG